MSRIGKLPIAVPSDISVELSDDGSITFKKGSLVREYMLSGDFYAEYNDSLLKIFPKNTDSFVDSFYGLHRKNIFNIVEGLKKPFDIVLELNGVGFKAVSLEHMLLLSLGYSHTIAFALPNEVTAKIEENRIILSSIDKQLLGQVASKIISLRKPEPYKGKGVKIFNKPILRKEGKKK